MSRLEQFYGEADMMGTPEAASDALHPDQWRSCVAACSTRARPRSPGVGFPVAVTKKPDNLCLGCLPSESDLL